MRLQAVCGIIKNIIGDECKQEYSETGDGFMFDLNNLKEYLKPYIDEYGIVKAAVFGSYARNAQREESDLDLLIEFNKSFDMIQFIHLKNMLEESLGKRIDIVEYCSLSPFIKEQVLREAVTIYGQG